ncbi:hypothetical protein DID75_04585 [Candidatus Marinamargulisbacteria bacterium SCGC AG-410-N11]|nr:hypothetical protein DID75_04585 [Candidatus Marinamargulisbacteria bacterium SCGC AG-410-N11]
MNKVVALTGIPLDVTLPFNYDVKNLPGLTPFIVRSYYLSMKDLEEKTVLAIDNKIFTSTRTGLVNWVCDFVSNFGFDMDITCLAIYYLDLCLSQKRMLFSNHQMLAIACIRVAVKFKASDDDVYDFLFELKQFFKKQFKPYTLFYSQSQNYELKAIKLLGWQVDRMTVYDFLSFYISQSIFTKNDRLNSKPLTFITKRKFTRLLKVLTCKGMTDSLIRQFLPSKLAATYIMTARRQLCIKPLWPKKLQQLTGYLANDLLSSFNLLWQLYIKEFPKQKNYILTDLDDYHLRAIFKDLTIIRNLFIKQRDMPFVVIKSDTSRDSINFSPKKTTKGCLLM